MRKNTVKKLIQYQPEKIEKKWQAIWEKDRAFWVDEDSKKKKLYILDMFPYPSGDGLHVGHPEGYTASDIIARYSLMNGKNILHPMGFDSFGLPAENAAIKRNIHPRDYTQKNIERFRKQIKSLGFMYDWSREVITSEPDYYKWTQWIFLQLFRRGLAYQAEVPINWCPSCKTGLANEEVIAGRCERCDTVVEKKKLKQWLLKITAYADRLLRGLDKLDWPESIKLLQKNWIGRSEGAEIQFKIKNEELKNKVFTTRPDTIFGATYLVLAPEHPLINNLGSRISNFEEIKEYINKAIKKSDLERTDLAKEKTGVELKGIKAINPANNEEIPIWVADYVMMNYGTGAIMAVPAHDERDFEFAKKYNLSIREVIRPLIKQFHGPDKVRDTPFSHRQAVVCIIKHWAENKYLCLQWKANDWHGFVIGGIDGKEDPIEAGYREILEETGYQSAHFIKKLGDIIDSQFYHIIKKENRWAHFQGLYFELADGKQKSIKDHEQNLHNIHWLTPDEVGGFLNVEDMKLLWKRLKNTESAYTGGGVIINSNQYNGQESYQAGRALVAKLKKEGLGDSAIQYKLRDWVFSRQRYWGEPIPVVHCEKCGVVSVPEKDLPVKLPELKDFKPTGTGESPLAKVKSWVNVKCPKCGSPAKRETNTMPQWAGSCWYYLRYCDPKNNQDVFKDSPDFHQPEIATTEKDRTYFEAFKKIYTDLEKQGIRIWAGNRLLLNGLNGKLWLPLRTVAFMNHEKDSRAIDAYLIGAGYTRKAKEKWAWQYEKNDIKVESIPIYSEGKNLVSYTQKKAVQKMELADLPSAELGWLFNFSYRVVSPEYNLSHYCFINKHESNTRKNLGDNIKIKFLERWLRRQNKKMIYWLPVDLYVGGAEHAVLHLLYARFWHMVLYDAGFVPTAEPFIKLRNQGLILGEDNQKMSKSRGNVINPDEVIQKFGADAMRIYEMFMGPFEAVKPWQTKGIIGIKRFLDKVWLIQEKIGNSTNKQTVKLLHQTIKKVSGDIETFNFNTAVSSLMILVNHLMSVDSISKKDFGCFVQLLSPFAPHLAEELWQKLGEKNSIFKSNWPKYDPALIKEDTFELVVQVNGKVRDRIMAASGLSEDEARNTALSSKRIKSLIQGKQLKKVIYIKNKLINIVV